ncbi:MAG: caspase family protein [Bacteroidota bacterium]
MKLVVKKIIVTLFCLQITNVLFSQFELIKKVGHRQFKSGTDISRNGKYFLSIDGSMKCLVWDISTGAQINIMYDVYKAKFSSDGESIYIVTGDKKFRQVDMAGKTLATFSSAPYKKEESESTMFFPEDDLFISNQNVFSLKKGYQKSLNINKSWGWGYSPVHKLLAVPGENKIDFFKSPNGEPAGSMKTMKSDNNSGVLFSDDGKKILVNNGGNSQIYLKESGALLRSFDVKGSMPFVVFDPTGNDVIWASQFGSWEKLTVTRAEIASGKTIWQRSLTIDSKYSSDGFGFGTFGKISPDGSTLLVSSQASDQFVLNAKAGNIIKTFKNLFPGDARSVVLNQDKTELSMPVGNKIVYWNLNNGTLDRTIDAFYPPQLNRADQVFYDKQSKSSETIVKKDKTGKVLKTYPGIVREVHAGFGGKYELLREWAVNNTCKRDGVEQGDLLKINDAQTDKTVFSKNCWVSASLANTQPVIALKESPNYEINFYNYLTGQKLFSLPDGTSYGGVGEMHFSPDDKYVVMKWTGKSIRILDLQNKRAYVVDERELQLDRDKGFHEILGFTPDNKFVVFRNAITYHEGPGFVKFLNLSTGKLDQTQTFAATIGDINSNLAFLKGDRFMLLTGTQGTVQVYDRATKKTAATLYPFEETGDWAVLTPGGLFDASSGAQNTMYYKSGSNIAPLSTVFEKYYTPKLLTRILNGEQFEPVPDINKLKTIPVVSVLYMEGTRNLVVEDEVEKTVNTNKTTGTVIVKADCPSDKVTEIRLYQNGKLVETTRNLTVEDDKGSTSQTKTFNVTLTEGSNVFKAVALNSERSESKPALINAKLIAEKKQNNNTVVKQGMNLHLVVVGINVYKNPKYNLNYAQADASSFRNAIQTGAKEIFSNITTYYVADNQATKEGIQSALEKVKQNAGAEDLLIFYYAGHGVLNDKKEFYLVPYDVTQLYGNDQSLAQLGISSAVIQQYSKDIKAQKQLFILDACQSAGALNDAVAMRGAAEEKAIAQLARATGTHWLTASGSDQFAAEFSQLGHGSFTWCLLEALKGGADNGDKKITVKELDSYLQNKVPEITQKYRGSAQYPASYGYGNDFPVIIVK